MTNSRTPSATDDPGAREQRASTTTALFGGMIAYVLLGLYVYAVIEGIRIAICLGTPGCISLTAARFTDGFATVLSTVGGLISALVIAELAITKAGEAPSGRAFGADPDSKIVKRVAVAYVIVWMLSGLAAFVVGKMLYPDKLQPLTDMGMTWLGLAVAAGYSYLKVAPKGG